MHTATWIAERCRHCVALHRSESIMRCSEPSGSTGLNTTWRRSACSNTPIAERCRQTDLPPAQQAVAPAVRSSSVFRRRETENVTGCACFQEDCAVAAEKEYPQRLSQLDHCHAVPYFAVTTELVSESPAPTTGQSAPSSCAAPARSLETEQITEFRMNTV